MSVFISYSSKNVSEVTKIVTKIRNNGYEVWFSEDSMPPGEDYTAEIFKAVKACNTFLLVFSTDASESKHVRKELALATNYNKTIMPVRVEDIMPNEAMEYFLSNIQWNDLFLDFDNSLEKFVNKVFPSLLKKSMQSHHIEKTLPEEYGEHSFFETNEEYIQRHIEYGFVYVTDFELEQSKYSVNTKEFLLNLNADLGVNSVKIEPKDAKALYKDSANRALYQKFALVDEELQKEYYIICSTESYKLYSSNTVILEQKRLQEEESFYRLFAWADKYALSEYDFPRNKEILVNLEKLDLPDKQITEIPREIVSLVNLKELDLYENQIKTIPRMLRKHANFDKFLL